LVQNWWILSNSTEFTKLLPKRKQRTSVLYRRCGCKSLCKTWRRASVLQRRCGCIISVRHGRPRIFHYFANLSSQNKRICKTNGIYKLMEKASAQVSCRVDAAAPPL
jgi:hypothetical protein